MARTAGGRPTGRGLSPTLTKGPVRFGLVAAVVALLSTVMAAPVSATTVTAVQSVPGSSQLFGVACASATTCVAVGYGTGDEVVVTITNGIPGAVQVISAASILGGVACPNASTCLVVGSQRVARPGQRPGSQGLVVPVTNGVAGVPIAVPAVLSLNAIACASATTCYALGVIAGGLTELVTITNGVPGTAQTVDGVGLTAIACASATTCYAIGGSAIDGSPLVVAIVNGVAGTPQAVPAAGILIGVACASATTCYTTGVSAEFSQTVLVPITNGTPGDAQVGPAFGAIACPNPTTCVSVGFDPNTGTALVVTIVNGIPGAPQSIPGSDGFSAVACATATTCEAVGGNNAAQVGVVATITVPPPCTTTLTGNRKGTVVTGVGVTCLSGAHITGSVIVPRGGSLDVENSTISGSITAIGASTVVICAATVRGSVAVSGATGFVLIGDPGDDNCAPNSIGGTLILQNNHYGLDAIGNHVSGAVAVSGNSGRGPFPDDTGPQVSGNGA